MPRDQLQPVATRLVSRRLRQLLVSLLQRIERVFHQGATTLCESVEASIASALVTIDREQRDRVVLPEEEDVVLVNIAEAERSETAILSRYHGFQKMFFLMSLMSRMSHDCTDNSSRFPEHRNRYIPRPREQQLHVHNQDRRDPQVQRPQCQHPQVRQDLQEGYDRPRHREQPPVSGRRGGVSGGPQPQHGRRSRRSRSRRSRGDGRSSHNPPAAPTARPHDRARPNVVYRAADHSNRFDTCVNTSDYCRCDRMSQRISRPTTFIQQTARQDVCQEGQGSRASQQWQQGECGGARAVDLSATGCSRQPVSGPPPPSYSDATRDDPAQPDLRNKLATRNRPAADDAAGARAQCSSPGVSESPLPAPPRVVNQRQRPVPYPSAGPPPNASTGAVPKQGQNARAELSRYESRQLHPLVDHGEGHDRPRLIYDMHPPGPREGAITLVANNQHRTLDKGKRYVYQLLYMCNPKAAGTIMYIGADAFADRDFPPYIVYPENERKSVERVPPREGPPDIPPFHVGSRQPTAHHRPVDAGTRDGRQSPEYEDISDSNQPAPVTLVERRAELDEEDDPRTVDLCDSDDRDTNTVTSDRSNRGRDPQGGGPQ